jgi:hypothetical protein
MLLRGKIKDRGLCEGFRLLFINKGDDGLTLRTWVRNANIENWSKNPIGRVKEVGTITFQFLRMRSNIDNVMLDKIIKRAINKISKKANARPANRDKNL